MLAVFTKSKTHFGWAGSTHKILSQSATNAANKSLHSKAGIGVFNANEISLTSVLPDKEKHAPYSHSADIDNLKSGDAFDLFNKYDSIIKKNIKNEDYENIEELTGRSLHYLQDMTTPPHSRNSLSSVITERDLKIHFKIEEDTKRLQSNAIMQAGKYEIDETTNFDDFLKSKMKENKEIYSDIKKTYAKKKNDKNARKIEKLEFKSLINSYQVSYRYIKEIGQLKKENDQKLYIEG